MKDSQTNSGDWAALVPELAPEGPRPQALYAALRGLIESGQLPPGTRLPPTREIARRLRLSRGAAVAAYERLAAEGYAEARVGAGTHVGRSVPVMPERTGMPGARGAGQGGRPARLPGDLGVAVRDEATLRVFRRLMNRHLARPPEEQFTYGDPQGDAALREQIAIYLRTARGVRCTAAQVVITTGSQGAIDLVVRALLDPGDAAWIEDPGYPMARAAMVAAGVVAHPVPVDAEGLDVAAGLRIAPDARAVYVTPSHQFPTGVSLTMPRRLALIDWAARAGAWIIEDDYDSEFRHDGPPLAAMQGMDAEGRVIYVGTFSKAIFPGLRLGYMVLPPALLDPVIALRAATDRAPSTLAMPALADFLREGHFAAHLRRARRQVAAAGAALVAVLAEGPARLVPPVQGLHVVVALPAGITEARALELAAAAGLGGRPLSAMHRGPEARRGIVLGVSGFPPEVLASAARRWLAALRSETGIQTGI